MIYMIYRMRCYIGAPYDDIDSPVWVAGGGRQCSWASFWLNQALTATANASLNTFVALGAASCSPSLSKSFRNCRHLDERFAECAGIRSRRTCHGAASRRLPVDTVFRAHARSTLPFRRGNTPGIISPSIFGIHGCRWSLYSHLLRRCLDCIRFSRQLQSRNSGLYRDSAAQNAGRIHCGIDHACHRTVDTEGYKCDCGGRRRDVGRCDRRRFATGACEQRGWLCVTVFCRRDPLRSRERPDPEVNYKEERNPGLDCRFWRGGPLLFIASFDRGLALTRIRHCV